MKSKNSKPDFSQYVQPGSLWQSLSIAQQQGVLEAFEESEDEKNLIPFSEVKAKYRNGL